MRGNVSFWGNVLKRQMSPSPQPHGKGLKKRTQQAGTVRADQKNQAFMTPAAKKGVAHEVNDEGD